MKTLKFKFDLNCKVAIYVPSTNNVSESTDNASQVIDIISKLSKLFGGATSSEAVGGWITSNGDTVIEKVNIVYSFCTSEQLSTNFEAILSICNELKISMNQEAITLEVNGQVKFV